jgi:hypothetical protein
MRNLARVLFQDELEEFEKKVALEDLDWWARNEKVENYCTELMETKEFDKHQAVEILKKSGNVYIEGSIILKEDYNIELV